MNREHFIERLQKIKEQHDTLNKYHDQLIEQNPFVEDGSGVMPNWLTDIILEHVITLFASVNEIALNKTKLDEIRENHPGKSLEEIAEEFGGSVNSLKKNYENVCVLKDLAEYFVYEMNWNGKISIGSDESDASRDYDFSDYGRLYDYVKNET